MPRPFKSPPSADVIARDLDCGIQSGANGTYIVPKPVASFREPLPMSAYLIADIEIKDEKALERYVAEVPAIVTKFGGRYIIRGPEVEVVEGVWKPRVLVALEFPTMDALKRWYNSEEYRPHRAARIKATQSNVVFAEGT